MTPPQGVLHNPHPLVKYVDVPNFNYGTYGWRHVLVSLDEHGVLLVTLNRPDKHNAYTTEMCHDMVFAFELADADPRVKAVVLTGAGKSFCAGADLSGGGFGASDSSITLNTHRDGAGQASGSLLNCRKLVIAAINGNCVGVGVTMLLPADLRIIAKTAKVGIPFTKRGIALEGMAAYFLPRLVGHANALDIAVTGDVVLATSPVWAPLWRDVLPAEEVLPTALALARRLAQENSVISMALNKTMIWRCPSTPEETHLLDSKGIFATARGDATEGIASFMEKRKAKFEGTLEEMEEYGFYPWWTRTDVEGKKTRGLAKL